MRFLITVRVLLFAASAASAAFAQNVQPSWRIAMEGQSVRITVSAKRLPAGASVTKAICTLQFLDGVGRVWETVQLPVPGLPVPAGEERSYVRAIALVNVIKVVRGIQMDWAVTQRSGPLVGVGTVGDPGTGSRVAPGGSSAPDVEFISAQAPEEITPTFKCSAAGRLKSPAVSDRVPTEIEFRNEATAPKVINWLDTTGIQHTFGEVAPGESRTVKTHLSQYWLVTDRSGECIGGIYVAPANAARIVLKR